MHIIRSQSRRGVSLIYAIVALVVFIGFAVLGVDAGRLMTAKAELQDCADGAARYAAVGMASSQSKAHTARQHAIAAIAGISVDGGQLSSDDMTVTVGTWNEATREFTADNSHPNAVKVDIAFALASGGRPKLFASAITNSAPPVIRVSAVAISSVLSKEYYPPASGNLWLSTALAGTENRNFRNDAPHVWDYAGSTGDAKQSPLEIQLSELNLNPGDALSFEGLSGTASYVASGGQNNADGQTNYIVALGQTYPGSVPNNNYNGLSNTRAPIGAVMAVFMNDDPSNSTAAPSNLDFNSNGQRNYDTLSPGLKQIFFVGDGKRNNGEVQKIIVPPGATRVFLGMMDAWQWNDNVGNFKFNVYGRKNVTTVK